MKFTSVRQINNAISEATANGHNLYVFDGVVWLRCFTAKTLAGKLMAVLCGNGCEPQYRAVTTHSIFDER